MTYTVDPIGTFHSNFNEKYEAPRQPGASPNNCVGLIRLLPHHNFEQALEDLDGFDKIWILFYFHRNTSWRPKVQPPRGDKKRGVFATRSPHRPNSIGMSCVDLLEIRGRELIIGNHDLLHETPIIDIKPYIPYADAFSNVKCGWVDSLTKIDSYQITWTTKAQQQLEWIRNHNGPDLESAALDQLQPSPYPHAGKRIRALSPTRWELAYKTWRLHYTVDAAAQVVEITDIVSGYTREALSQTEDRWGDLAIHQAYTTAISPLTVTYSASLTSDTGFSKY